MRQIIIVLFSVFLVNGALCEGTNTDTNRIYQTLLQATNNTKCVIQSLPDIEKLWSLDQTLYLKAANRAVLILQGGAEDKNIKEALLNLFTNVLEKACPTNQEQAIDWVILKTQMIQSSIDVNVIQNEKWYWLGIAKFAGEVHSKIIPNYQNQGRMLSIVYVGAGAKEREEYLKMTVENKKNLIQDRFQYELRESEYFLRFMLKNKCIFYKPDAHDTFTTRLISLADLTDEKPLFRAKFKPTDLRYSF